MTEHLLTASDPVLLPLEVPFVCKKSYEIGNFILYPTHRGFALNADGFLVIRKDQRHEIPSLLQEWLYFGLLKEFLGREIDEREYFRTSPSTGQRVLYTANLPFILQQCRRRLLALKKDNRSSISDTIFACTTTAAFQCRCIDQEREWTMRDGLPSILLSIRLLIDSLIIATTEFDDSVDSFTKQQRLPLCKELEGIPPSTSILLDHMVRNGWCIHQANLFCGRFTYAVIYYLASIRRKPSDQNHQDCEGEENCVAHNTNPKTYQCRHVKQGCSCQHISISSEDIKAVIKDGGIPLISFTKTRSGCMQHKVFRAKSSTKYTAVSHLWSDGLGNPNQNTLPECQINNLVDQVREAYQKRREIKNRKGPNLFKWKIRKSQSIFSSPINIWMDTLCIPVNDEHLRMKAINRMTPIYKRAKYVIVVDSELKWAAKAPNPLETCAHLNMSAWSGRSWTLQEGALAAEILFPVPDCGKLPPDLRSKEGRYIHEALHKAHQLPLVGRWEKENESQVRQSQFMGVWNALLGRTTTMDKDVHGIFANLLDFHAEEILLLAREHRMKTLLCSQEQLPLKILYEQSPRYFAEGPFDRWLPDFPKGSPISESDSWMDVTSRGLLIKPEDVCGRTIIIMHEPRETRLERYCLDIEGWGKIGLATQVKAARKYVEMEFDSTLLHLDKDAKHLLTSGLRVMGASFAVSTANENAVKVVFDDPITIKSWDQVCEDPEFQDCPRLNATLVANSQAILIDIGIESAYKANFRRKPHLGLRAPGTLARWVMFFVFLPILSFVAFAFALTVYAAFSKANVIDGTEINWSTLGMITAFTMIFPGLPICFFSLAVVDAVLRERDYRRWLQSYDELRIARKKQLSWKI